MFGDRRRDAGLTDPVVRPEVGEDVEQGYVARTEPGGAGPERGQRGCDAQIRDQDVVPVCGFEVGSVASEVEVAALVPRRGPHSREGEVVDDQIDRKGNQLVEKQGHQRDNRGVLDQCPCLQVASGGVPRSHVVLLHHRHKRNVPLQIVRRFVVLGVSQAP